MKLGRHAAKFLDNIHSNSFVPYITLPTCITPKSKTLINNIFFNDINEVMTLGNLITDILDYFVQFLIIFKALKKEPKKLIHKRCFKNFNEDFFAKNL